MTLPYQFPMERVLYTLHHKCGVFALNNISPLSRSRAEHFVFFAGVCSLGALILVHSTFVYPTGLRSTCLESIPHFIKESDLIHIRLTNEATSHVLDFAQVPVPASATATATATVESASDIGVRAFTDEEAITSLGNTDRKLDGKHSALADEIAMETTNSDRTASATLVDTTTVMATATTTATGPFFSFAREKAYLYFSPELVQRHGIRVQTVHVSKRDENCFGDPFVQFLVYVLNGYDTVMVNWLIGTYTAPSFAPGKHIAHSVSQEGYMYNQHTREPPTDIRSSSYQLFNNDMSTIDALGGSGRAFRNTTGTGRTLFRWLIEQLINKGSVVIKTSFLFFITTKLVAFTLRETQNRMLDFTHHLEECFRYNRPVIHLVTTHVVENLVFVPVMVGMIFFLINFYRGDMFIAFFVLSLVWVCESLSLVGLRTEKAIHYFPLFFFPFFAIFHYYYIACPWGFSYAALFTSMCFILHSMLFFWHRYELPAVQMAIANASEGPQLVYTELYHAAADVQHQRHPTPEESTPFAQPANMPYPNTRESVRRTHSFNTTTSSVLSRNSSSHGMFQRGNENEDGDASSAQYGMGGEYVSSRRTRGPPPLSVTSHSNDASLGSGPTSTSDRQRRPMWSGRERYASGLEPVVASVSTDEDSVQLVRGPSPCVEPGSTIGTTETTNTAYVETSALQAILSNEMDEDDSIATTAHRDWRTGSISEITSPTDTIFR